MRRKHLLSAGSDMGLLTNEPTGPPQTRQRLLLVDDDDLLRGALEILLSELYEVDTASSAEMAMDRFVVGRYDLLVTDLRLPGRDGDVMARALRSIDRSMPTLLITGDDLQDGDQRLDGFDGWLQKPFFDLDAVLKKVATILQQSRLRRVG